MPASRHTPASTTRDPRLSHLRGGAIVVPGGYGYSREFPVERPRREAKVVQIFEGTNQIQRPVISRALAH